MLNNKYYDPFIDDDFDEDQDPEEDGWDKISEGEEIPERIEWLEEIDSGELDNYSFENDMDDFELDDI